MPYRPRIGMWPVTEAHLMAWNDTNSFTLCTHLCVSVKTRFSYLLKAAVGLLLES